jgi:cytoskeletal protein CcmA (bactofilin family)
MVLGQLDSAGEIHIHGTLKGDVCASRIMLGADGFVEGNLIAQEAILGGRIEGRVFAFNVMVEGTAVIHGNVFHHELTVAAGAHLDGRTPWRPVNYFENISQDFQGDIDEHVHAQ